jgi:hypothetical protein
MMEFKQFNGFSKPPVPGHILVDIIEVSGERRDSLRAEDVLWPFVDKYRATPAHAVCRYTRTMEVNVWGHKMEAEVVFEWQPGHQEVITEIIIPATDESPKVDVSSLIPRLKAGILKNERGEA